MVTTSEGTVPPGVEVPQCFGRLHDSSADECKRCHINVQCLKKQQGESSMQEDKAVEKEDVPQGETPAAKEAPEPEAPTKAEAPAEVEAPAEAEEKPAFEAPEFERLRIRANTAGAYALMLLGQDFYTPSALKEAVAKACGGKGTKAHDMINRAKRAELLEEKGEGRDKAFKLKA